MKSTDAQKAWKRRDHAERSARNRQYVLERKQAPCHDCGGTYHPVCLDFHHIAGTKKNTVSNLTQRGVPLSVLQAEIEKCVLLCANCHRLRHL